MEQIRNDSGIIIGNIITSGDTITYRHLKYGIVGTYNTRARKYTRLNKLLGVAIPMSNEDYGRSDVITLDKLASMGLVK